MEVLLPSPRGDFMWSCWWSVGLQVEWTLLGTYRLFYVSSHKNQVAWAGRMFLLEFTAGSLGAPEMTPLSWAGSSVWTRTPHLLLNPRCPRLPNRAWLVERRRKEEVSLRPSRKTWSGAEEASSAQPTLFEACFPLEKKLARLQNIFTAVYDFQ